MVLLKYYINAITAGLYTVYRLKAKGGIIMKRLLSVITLMTVIAVLLASCGGSKVSKEDAEAMAGKWVLVTYDYLGVKMLPEDADTKMSFEFKDNGMTTFTLDNEHEDYKWEKNDTLVTIWVPEGGVSKGHTAVLEDNYFTLYWNYEGTPVKMTYAREGSSAVNPDLYIKDGDITSTMLKKSNENNILELLEKMTPEAREAFGVTEIYNQLKKPGN